MLELASVHGQREGDTFRLIAITNKPEAFVFFCTQETHEELFAVLMGMAEDPDCGLNPMHVRLLLLKFKRLLDGIEDQPSVFSEKIGWELQEMEGLKMQATHRFQ